MGMTWGIKLQRVALAIGVVAALAMASGAQWIEFSSWFTW
jgi:hypothetical protein